MKLVHILLALLMQAVFTVASALFDAVRDRPLDGDYYAVGVGTVAVIALARTFTLAERTQGETAP